MKTALSTVGLAALLALAAPAQTPPTTPVDDAITVAVRREAMKVDLRRKLADAQEAQKKNDLSAAAKLYEDCLRLVKDIGGGIDAERTNVLSGFVATRMGLADAAMRRSDFGDAENQLARILKEDPKNQAALALRARNDKLRAAEAGRRPDDETIAKLPAAEQDAVKASTLVQNAKLLFEAGRLDDAEQNLREARKVDPNNKQSLYYLALIADRRQQDDLARREIWAREKMLEVSKAWNDSIKRDTLPVPNPYARTNLVHTSKNRQVIYSKLERIRLEELKADGLPLSEVAKTLSDEARKRDPERKGINIIVSASADPIPTPPPTVDPQTGLPIPSPQAEQVEIGSITVKLMPPLYDLTLMQALDAIQKTAERPIKFSIEDYAVVFSLKAPDTNPPLHTRTFKVDPNTFFQGLQGVQTFNFGAGGGGFGGGGYGGGGYGGGGYGGGRGGRSGGYGGGGYGGGGYGGGGYGGGGYGGGGGGGEYVGVMMSGGYGGLGGGGFGGRGGFGGGFGGQGGIAGRQGVGGTTTGGIRSITEETPQQIMISAVADFFGAAGINLTNAGRQVFFNDRLGMLVVRATLQELDTIEQAIQVLNMAPPQVMIEAKFAEVTQEDTRALGFNWYWGNTLMRGGDIGVQGGTAPSFQGQGSAANPNGVFPGPSLVNAIPPAATDNILTPGLRNTAPAIATMTGILTDPQFRVVIHALEQRTGVELLVAPKVTTLSGRQAQIKTTEIRSIPVEIEATQNANNLGFGGGGGFVQ